MPMQPKFNRMRNWLAVALGACLVSGVYAAVELNAPMTALLPTLMPQGALLYVETPDLHALLGEWNQSAEQKAWLTGANYQAFSRSRLFGRLGQAQDEFSTTAGLPADSSLLSTVSGRESALAVYDIGNLEFVFVTRMDEATVASTPLWQLRGKFEERKTGDTTFYTRKDQQSGRVASFGTAKGWLVIATREDLTASVLARVNGVEDRTLTEEPWYAALGHLATGQPELRMALNLEKIVPSPYFRSYWIQRNITEMKQYSAAESDLYREDGLFREERLLIRRTGAETSGPQPVTIGDLAQMHSVVPGDATFVQGQAAPTPEAVLAALRDDVLERKPEASSDASTIAPQAAAIDGVVGAGEMETRIDDAPKVTVAPDSWLGMKQTLAAASPTAIVEVFQDRAPAPDSVFVRLDAGCAVMGSQAWNLPAVEDAVVHSLGSGITAGGLGTGWQQRTGTGGSYQALSGSVGLYLAVRDRILLVATDPTLMEAMLAGIQSGAVRPSGITYAARFRHSKSEQENYRRLFTRLDRVSRGAATSDDTDGQQPAFFSGNIGSLDRTFAALTEEQVVERDQGTRVTQTVTYRWK